MQRRTAGAPEARQRLKRRLQAYASHSGDVGRYVRARVSVPAPPAPIAEQSIERSDNSEPSLTAAAPAPPAQSTVAEPRGPIHAAEGAIPVNATRPPPAAVTTSDHSDNSTAASTAPSAPGGIATAPWSPLHTAVTTISASQSAARQAVVFTVEAVAQLTKTARENTLSTLPRPRYTPTAPNRFSGALQTAEQLARWLHTVRAWVASINLCSEPPAQQVSVVANLLEGAASEWWSRVVGSAESPTTLTAFDIALHTRFAPTSIIDNARTALRAVSQGKNSIQTYVNEFFRYSDLVPGLSPHEALYDFLRGLGQPLQAEVRKANCTTLLAARDQALLLDGVLAQSRGPQTLAHPAAATVAALDTEHHTEGHATTDAAAPPAPPTPALTQESLERALVAALRGRGPLRPGSGSGSGSGQRSTNRYNRAPPGPCPKCRQTGHWAFECPNPRVGAPSPRARQPGSERCFGCGGTGHRVADCPSPAATARPPTPRGN